MGDLIYKSDSDLHVCFLQSSVGSAESLIDLGLDILCLVDQLHHFTDQDITLFVHKRERTSEFLASMRFPLVGKVFGSIKSPH